MNSQKQTILNMLIDSEWVCTSQMYAAYIADVRRRLCDLQKDGYILTSKKCELHDYHKGGSKMWHLILKPKDRVIQPLQKFAPKLSEFGVFIGKPIQDSHLSPNEVFYSELKQMTLIK